MNTHSLFILLCIGVFCLVTYAVSSIPSTFMQYSADWQKLLYIFYVLSGFCLIPLAYWNYKAHKDIDNLYEEMLRLSGKLRKMENTTKHDR